MLTFREELSKLMDNILLHYSGIDTTILYYPVKINPKKYVIEDNIYDEEIIMNDIPINKFDELLIKSQENITTESYNKQLAKDIVYRNYDNTIKRYEKRLITLNGTLNKVEDILNNENNSLSERDTFRYEKKLMSTQRHISNINSMITNTTNCKAISTAIISGYDKVYAFKKNYNSNIISTLVKQPSIANLIQKEVDQDVIQQDYIDLINEITTTHKDSINPNDWIFCKKSSSSTTEIHSTERVANVRYHFGRNNTIPFLRSSKILFITKVRVTLTVFGEYNYNYHRHCDIKETDFKFHVLNNNNHKYHFITEEDLCDMSHKENVMKWKIKSIVTFLNNWDDQKKILNYLILMMMWMIQILIYLQKTAAIMDYPY